jgi:hypothetical protein
MIETIKKLFSSKEFYKTIKDKKVGSAVGIIALLSLIIGVVMGVLFYLQSGATLKSDIDGFVQNNIVSEFPSDLKVTNVSGVLSSNLNPITFGEQSELLDEPIDGVQNRRICTASTHSTELFLKPCFRCLCFFFK